MAAGDDRDVGDAVRHTDRGPIYALLAANAMSTIGNSNITVVATLGMFVHPVLRGMAAVAHEEN